MGSSKVNNRQHVLDMLRKNREVSISDVSESVGASKPTVKKALDFYIEAGLVETAGKGYSGDEGGKRPGLYRFRSSFGYFICIHLGPDFINAALLDLDLAVAKSAYIEITDLSAEQFEDRVVSIVEEFSSDNNDGCRILSLIIGMAGVVDENTGESVFSPHFQHWPIRHPFKDRLSKRLPVQMPIYLDCVNRYQALAEMERGVAAGKNNFMIIDILSEGVGAGIVVNGSIRHGAQSFSGEIGHIVLDPEGSDGCICGGNGCFEALVSERRVRRMISEGLAARPQSILKEVPEQSGFDELFSAVKKGDEFALEILDDLVFWFASGLNNIIMINDPELIVIQGIFTNAGDIFIDKLRHRIREKVYIHLERDVDIRYSSLGDERGVLGCGVFGMIKFFENRKLYSGDVMILE